MAHGQFIWNELNTHDAGAARSFYAATLGWRYTDMPMADGRAYGLIWSGDARVGGIFPMVGPEMARLPEHWIAYVDVDDVDARVAGVAAAGGTVIREPWSVAGVGRIAIVRAPGGAVNAWMQPMPPE